MTGNTVPLLLPVVAGPPFQEHFLGRDHTPPRSKGSGRSHRVRLGNPGEDLGVGVCDTRGGLEAPG